MAAAPPQGREADGSAGLAGDRPCKAEPRLALPTGTLLLAVSVAILMVAGVWSAAIALMPLGMPEFVSGMAGIGVTAVVALAGIVVITPWKERAIADWMTVWLGGTVFRMMVTPLAAYVLYSALSPSLAVRPFGLAVALTYLATLFVEAAVLARYVGGAVKR